MYTVRENTAPGTQLTRILLQPLQLGVVLILFCSYFKECKILFQNNSCNRQVKISNQHDTIIYFQNDTIKYQTCLYYLSVIQGSSYNKRLNSWSQTVLSYIQMPQIIASTFPCLVSIPNHF